jgi:nitrogen fixation-related uncharacterized protein
MTQLGMAPLEVAAVCIGVSVGLFFSSFLGFFWKIKQKTQKLLKE